MVSWQVGRDVPSGGYLVVAVLLLLVKAVELGTHK